MLPTHRGTEGPRREFPEPPDVEAPLQRLVTPSISQQSLILDRGVWLGYTPERIGYFRLYF